MKLSVLSPSLPPQKSLSVAGNEGPKNFVWVGEEEIRERELFSLSLSFLFAPVVRAYTSTTYNCTATVKPNSSEIGGK